MIVQPRPAPNEKPSTMQPSRRRKELHFTEGTMIFFGLCTFITHIPIDIAANDVFQLVSTSSFFLRAKTSLPCVCVCVCALSHSRPFFAPGMKKRDTTLPDCSDDNDVALDVSFLDRLLVAEKPVNVFIVTAPTTPLAFNSLVDFNEQYLVLDAPGRGDTLITRDFVSGIEPQ